MSPLNRSRTARTPVVALLTVVLSAPLAVNAQDQRFDGLGLAAQEQSPVLAPDAGPSWEETSGYQSVEASRVDLAVVTPAASTMTDAASGYGTVEANCVLIAQHALASSDLGSRQEEALFAVVAAVPSWDRSSGYGAVEASRAIAANPTPWIPPTSQVPLKVRWAPARASAPAPRADANRTATAVDAALASGPSREAASGERAASAVYLPDALPHALADGMRGETTHLATVPLPGADAVKVYRTQR
jgi:hypothetical protein